MRKPKSDAHRKAISEGRKVKFALFKILTVLRSLIKRSMSFAMLRHVVSFMHYPDYAVTIHRMHGELTSTLSECSSHLL